jgi:DNA-binding MarR family transcriptional regulator
MDIKLSISKISATTTYSLTKARILFEIDRNCPITTQYLCDEIDVDKGYMKCIEKSDCNVSEGWFHKY